MLTGRDLIIYIMENQLEDNYILDEGRLLGFMTLSEAAVKFGVGLVTVEVWWAMDYIEGIKIGEDIYISMDAQKPVFD